MRTLKELNLCDDFLFKETMKDEHLAAQLLQTVLDLPGKIEKIEYIQEEKSIQNSYFEKGIRLDVYIMDGHLTVYNVEVQQYTEPFLPKRSRKYQSAMDMGLLKKGENYDKLNTQYIIICTFDPFGYGLSRYTFSNRCHEISELELGDETQKVFLYTHGNTYGISKELIEFLAFMENSTKAQADLSESPFIKALSDKVEAIKGDEALGGVFMTFEEKMEQYGRHLAEEAVKETILETARKLKLEGIPVETIVKCTDLSLEEIDRL